MKFSNWKEETESFFNAFEKSDLFKLSQLELVWEGPGGEIHCFEAGTEHNSKEILDALIYNPNWCLLPTNLIRNVA